MCTHKCKCKWLIFGVLFFLLFIFFFLFPHRVLAANRTIVYIGDSRTVGMHATVKNTSWRVLNDEEGNEVWIAQSGMSYQWFTETGMPEALPYLQKGNCDLVILMGCNDCINPDTAYSYTSYLSDNNIADIADTNRVFFASVGPMGHMGDGSETNYKNLTNDGNVSSFNANLKNSLPNSVIFLDLYTAMVTDGYATVDGVHYDGTTNQYIYQYLTSQLANTTQSEAALTSNVPKHTLTLDPNGGVLKGESTQEIAEGQYISGLPVVSKNGCQFTGWQMEDGSIVEQNFPMPDHNVTLKAIWKEMDNIPYTITRQYEQGSGQVKEETETRYGTVGKNITVTPEEREGYTTPETQTQMIKEDGSTVFVFLYKRQSYKITVQIGDGVEYTGKQTWRALYGSSIILKADCKPGYDNLFFSGDTTTASFSMPAKDCTIRITATPITYHITYTGDHVDTSGLQKTFTVADLPLRLSDGTSTFPYTFRTWTDKEGNSIKSITEPADIKLYAKTTNLILFLVFGISSAIMAMVILCMLFDLNRNSNFYF